MRKNKRQKEILARAAKDLINETPPAVWVSYLFNLQTQLIGSCFFDGYTRKGFEEHANFFGDLHHFFNSLSEVENK